MKISYLAVWKAVGERCFELVGVIGASTHQAKVYSPKSDLDPSLAGLKRAWETVRETRQPLEWLQAITDAGGGYAYEYGAIQQIAAASLDQALMRAYSDTAETYGGTVTDLYEPVKGEVTDLHVIDPNQQLENAVPGDVTVRSAT